jgi:hypothetical protein
MSIRFKSPELQFHYEKNFGISYVQQPARRPHSPHDPELLVPVKGIRTALIVK